MKFDFLTSAYEFAHGKKPRGSGRWAFKIAGQGDSEAQFFSGTFSDAKKLAQAHFSRLIFGRNIVSVTRPGPVHFTITIEVMS